MGQYKNDYILLNFVKIGIVIYYNFNYLEFGVLNTSLWSGCQHIWTQKPDSYAALTKRTVIGKLYTVLNPLYSLLRLNAIFIKENIAHLNSFDTSIHFLA